MPIGLRPFGPFPAICGDRDDVNAALLELGQLLFEFGELSLADRAMQPAIEHQQGESHDRGATEDIFASSRQGELEDRRQLTRKQ